MHDTEPSIIPMLAEFGYQAKGGSLGYRTGQKRLDAPPHEFDLILIDLKKPACFDMKKWGEGGNNNRSFKLIEAKPDGSYPGGVFPRMVTDLQLHAQRSLFGPPIF